MTKGLRTPSRTRLVPGEDAGAGEQGEDRDRPRLEPGQEEDEECEEGRGDEHPERVRPARRERGDEGLLAEEETLDRLRQRPFPDEPADPGDADPEGPRRSEDPGEPCAGVAIGLPESREGHPRRAEEDAGPGTEEDAREVGRVQEAVPEGERLREAPGGQHEAEDSLDDHEGHECGEGVEPDQEEVCSLGDLPPRRDPGERRHDLEKEERPLRRPGPDERVDERRRCGRVDDADREPDAHTRDRPEDGREKEEDHRRPLHEFAERSVVPLHGRGLEDGHDEAASDREVRHDDVQDRDEGDQDPAAHREFPDRVVQLRLLAALRGCGDLRRARRRRISRSSAPKGR